MLNRLYLPILALAAAAAVALAMVWPQGLGERSPGPFGSFPLQRTPAKQAARTRETISAQRRSNQLRAAAHDIQSHALAPSQ